MKPLILRSIEKALRVSLNNEAYGDIVIKAVSTDTRTIKPGNLFVPVKGPNFDGHNFINDAFKKGAACALSQVPVFDDRPVITVRDTGKALLDLAAYYKSLFNIKTVAITGSNGKTTTKDMIASVLARKYKVIKNKGNLNNEVGLPMTLFNIEDDTDIAVVEMGMRGLGQVRELSAAARPDAAVITNIGVSHIEILGSRENILKAKLEIIDGLSRDGVLYLNSSDDLLKNADCKGASVRYFGFNKEDYVRAENIEKLGIRGVSFTLAGHGFSVKAHVPMPGEHTVQNALAAAAVGLGFGLTPEEIREGLKDFTPSDNRLNIMETPDGITIIDDTYNANPDSAKAALEVLNEAGGRKICVLGDMLELGENSPALHEGVGKRAAELGINLIVCVGKLSRETFKGAFGEIEQGRLKSLVSYFPDRDSALVYLTRELEPGDTVLIKASRAMEFEHITLRLQNKRQGGV